MEVITIQMFNTSVFLGGVFHKTHRSQAWITSTYEWLMNTNTYSDMWKQNKTKQNKTKSENMINL